MGPTRNKPVIFVAPNVCFSTAVLLLIHLSGLHLYSHGHSEKGVGTKGDKNWARHLGDQNKIRPATSKAQQRARRVFRVNRRGYEHGVLFWFFEL